MASEANPKPLYLDSSALVKLVIDEPQTSAIRETVAGRGLISTEIAITEIGRAASRSLVSDDVEALDAMREAVEGLLSGLAYVSVTRELLTRAGSFSEPWLRTLDAIHVASALEVADEIEAFVTYDERQLGAAERAGLSVLSPTTSP